MFFFVNDTATTEIYTRSLHDALPIFATALEHVATRQGAAGTRVNLLFDHENDAVKVDSPYTSNGGKLRITRSEEHTSELQSRQYLVCRLLLEKKKNHHTYYDRLPCEY